MPRWTLEAREIARKRALKSKLWEKSTGPKTIKGKAISSCNAMKHGLYTEQNKKLLRLLSTQSRYVRAVIETRKSPKFD